MAVSLCAGVVLALLVGFLPRRSPNVVLIVVDTLRASALSTAIGNPETPNLAKLAAEATQFKFAFAHAPMTVPSHAALFSGRHPWETGVLNNGQDLPDDLPLLTEALRDNGYQTAAAVSLATLWPRERLRGFDRGFDHYDNGELEVAPAQDTSARLRKTLDLLNPSEPFYLFAHFSDPHEPYNLHQGPDRIAEIVFDDERAAVVTTSKMSYWEAELELTPGLHRLVIRSGSAFKLRSLECSDERGPVVPRFVTGELLVPGTEISVELSNAGAAPTKLKVRAWLNDVPSLEEIHARYAAEVREVDAAIGVLVAELEARDLWDNTLVVFTSDHGEALGEHGTVGHVVNLYDELIHVPLLVRLPGGRQDDDLRLSSRGIARHVDILPTILETLDIAPPDKIAGESLFLVGERQLVAETHPPEAPRTLFCVRDQTYKLVFDPEAESFEMYRLGPDPLELDNVYGHQGHLRKTWELILRRLAGEIEIDESRDEVAQRRLSALGY